MTPHRTVHRPSWLALPGSGPLKPLLPPEPLHPSVVHGPALRPEQEITCAGPSRCDRRRSRRDDAATSPPRSRRLSGWRWALPQHSADQEIGNTVTLLQDRDGAPGSEVFRPPRGAPHGATRFLSIAFSQLCFCQQLFQPRSPFPAGSATEPPRPTSPRPTITSCGRWVTLLR